MRQCLGHQVATDPPGRAECRAFMTELVPIVTATEADAGLRAGLRRAFDREGIPGGSNKRIALAHLSVVCATTIA